MRGSGKDDGLRTSLVAVAASTCVVIGMLIVILMNVAFIWIAVSGQDQVVDTYQTETR